MGEGLSVCTGRPTEPATAILPENTAKGKGRMHYNELGMKRTVEREKFVPFGTLRASVSQFAVVSFGGHIRSS